MNNRFINPIRSALDECLVGVVERPSLRNQVLKQVRGEIKVKRKLSFSLTLALFLLLATVTAFAVSALCGFLYLDKTDIGSPWSCTATDDALYYMTSQGLYAWTPPFEESITLASRDALSNNGISTNSLIFYDDCIMILDKETKKIWRYHEDTFDLLLDYDGTELDISDVRFANPVFQDGYLFIRVINSGNVEEAASIYKVNIQNGKIEKLPIFGAVELTKGAPGKLLVLQRDTTNREDRLVIVATDTGKVCEQIVSVPVLGVEGIAYSEDQHSIYAVVNGYLAFWNGEIWVEENSYAQHHLSYYYTIIDNGYISVSYDGIQYTPITTESNSLTLTICGYRTSDNVDHDYQRLRPGISIVRQQDASINIGSVRRAIQSGDTTDLFYVKLDTDVLEMMTEGLVAPLSSSIILQTDASEMLPQVTAGVCRNNTLYAVPSDAFVTIWSAHKDVVVPKTVENLLQQHLKWNQTGDSAFLSEEYSEQEWQKEDYAKYLLKTYIVESSHMKRMPDFCSESFVRTLQFLKSVQFQQFSETTDKSVIIPNTNLSLQGKQQDASVPELIWILPPTIDEGMSPVIQTRLHVYLLNPNSQHKDEAIDFLEYVATHRSAHNQALLKPESSTATLHIGVEGWITDIIAEQHAADAAAGIETDEAALEERVIQIRSSPDSWEVTQDALSNYRENIAPYTNLMLHPLLAGSATQANRGVDALLEIMMDYLNGDITLEECTTRMNVLVGEQISVK